MPRTIIGSWPCWLTAVAGLMLVLVLPGCGSDGADGATGSSGTVVQTGTPTPTGLTKTDNSPGLTLAITSVTGGSGPGGSFNVGDRPVVTFTAKKSNGVAWLLSELSSGRIWLSGPTANYQKVLPRASDVATASVINADGSFTYTMAPIPANYAIADGGVAGTANAPDGNWGNTPLVAGPYTVAMSIRWNYTVDGVANKDVGAATKDIIFGTAVAEAREVVKDTNCNVCHVKVSAHGGGYTSAQQCVTCHVAGAKRSGVPIEFKVMIHKIHNGMHLPSVNGVTVDTAGVRQYTAPTAYTVGTGADFSAVNFPVFPSFQSSMPRPSGYSVIAADTTVLTGATVTTATDTKKEREDLILRGVVACYKCHGDPDGSGSLTAPAKGFLHDTGASRRACGSCHDDIDWTKPYQRNGMTMPPQADDTQCASCHYPTAAIATAAGEPNGHVMTVGGAGTVLITPVAHAHPLANPVDIPEANSQYGNNGLKFAITASVAGGSSSGTFVAGDKPSITFTVKDNANANVPLYSLQAISTALTGPTDNRQLVFPLSGPKSVTIPVCDFSGRLVATSGTGKGVMSRVVGSRASEVLEVRFTSATDFDVIAVPSRGAYAATALGSSGTATMPSLFGASTYTDNASISEIELAANLAPQQIRVLFGTIASGRIPYTVQSYNGATWDDLGTGSLDDVYGAKTRFEMTGLGFSITNASPTATTPTPARLVAGKVFYMSICQTSDFDVATPGTHNHKFAIVAGRSNFSSANGDRFYYETVNNTATSYTYNLPMDLVFECLGDATVGADSFTAGNLPVYWGREAVYERTLTGTSQNSIGAVTAQARSIVLPVAILTDLFPAPATVPSPLVAGTFVNNKYMVIEDGVATRRDHVQVGSVSPISGSTDVRVFFKTPLRYDHASGVACQTFTVAQRMEGVTYTLDAATGAVAETGAGFTGTSTILMSYRTDGAFGWKRRNGDTVQAVFQPPPNDSSDLGQSWGEWAGLAFQNGTYTAAVWGSKPIYVTRRGETQTYQLASNAALKDLRYGTAGTTTAYNLITSQANCESCHDQITFHGGSRKGNDSCAMCHAVAGMEDWPAYASTSSSTNPPAATTGVTSSFRTMLHKIHMGRDLANASTYTVVGNNGSSSTFEEIGFPVMPGGVKACDKCHGTGSTATAWKDPGIRAHDDQTVPTKSWTIACSSCHDAPGYLAHMELMTTASGAESCATCHGPGSAMAVDQVHKNR